MRVVCSSDTDGCTSNSTVKMFSGNLIPGFLVSLFACSTWKTSKSDSQAEEGFWTSMEWTSER